MRLAIFVVNEQKKEIDDFVKNSDGTIKYFSDENEVLDYRSNIGREFKYTGYVFDIDAGEIIDWFP